MKNIFFISFIILNTILKAQTIELTSNTWYLEQVIINSVSYPTPSNSEISTVTAIFSNSNFHTQICNTFSGTPVYNNSNHSFSFNGQGLTLIMCQNTLNNSFENHYFGTFFGMNSSIPQPFSYTITPQGNLLKLTLTNTQGNQAIYYSAYLSSEELKLSQKEISFYPNPTDKILKIKADLQQVGITITDNTGKNIFYREYKDFSNSAIEIELSSFAAGQYHLLVTDLSGRKKPLTFKFIKK